MADNEKEAEARARRRDLFDHDWEFGFDEQRVVDYLCHTIGSSIGAGLDPVGFLIASHASLRGEIQNLLWSEPTKPFVVDANVVKKQEAS
jgi:hypothetical protein